MKETKMKNMIVLKNLPSNVIEEAFVIVKSTKKAKNLQDVEKKEQNKRTIDNKKINDESSNYNSYIVKEAEVVISNYIESLEIKDKKNSSLKINNKNNIKLKIYSCLTTIIIFTQILITYFR